MKDLDKPQSERTPFHSIHFDTVIIINVSGGCTSFVPGFITVHVGSPEILPGTLDEMHWKKYSLAQTKRNWCPDITSKIFDFTESKWPDYFMLM